MAIRREVNEKVKRLNQFKFANFPSVKNDQVGNVVGSYVLCRFNSKYKLVQRVGNNNEAISITPYMTLKAIEAMIDLSSSIVIEKQQRVKREVKKVESKHEQEVENKAKSYAEDIYQDLIKERDYYKNLYQKQKSKYEDLQRDRQNLRAYVKKHFKL
mgnify:CR=1 FL=1|tara:strand:- start:594 stop:1064 length:471 start_codon:yes stop_codon:yes gene_type:complete